MLYNIMLISSFLLHAIILFTGGCRRLLWFFFSYTFGFIKPFKFGVVKQVEEDESLELSLWEGNKDYFISHAAWCLVVYTIRISMETIKHSRKKNKQKV